MTFITRPISGTLLGLVAIFITWQVVAFILQTREKRAQARNGAAGKAAEATA